MTPLYPFTPAGVQQKLEDVYALSDPDLLVQANAVKADLRLWVSNNFTLTTEQQTYLTNLDDRAVDYIGNESSFCFIYRLPIILIQEAKSDPPQLKFVRTESTTRISANDNGDFVASGTFIVKIVYE